MEFLEEALENYVRAHSSQETSLLSELNRATHLKVLQPRMLSGHLQGRVLSMFSKMIQPKRILEIGTYTGYSAICLAEGLSEGGELHTIDINEELHDFSKYYVEKAGLQHQIKSYIGNALDLIPQLNQDWDLIFIDADKENYSKYYQLLIDKLKTGAYLIADNVLWSGKVINAYKTLDLETKALVDFNEMVQADSRVENVLLPVRDGLMLIRKI